MFLAPPLPPLLPLPPLPLPPLPLPPIPLPPLPLLPAPPLAKYPQMNSWSSSQPWSTNLSSDRLDFGPGLLRRNTTYSWYVNSADGVTTACGVCNLCMIFCCSSTVCASSATKIKKGV